MSRSEGDEDTERASANVLGYKLMFSHLKESAIFTFKAMASFFNALTFGVVALSDWLKGFAPVNDWFFVFLLPKLLIVLIGLLVTSIPLWVLVLVSFLPLQIIVPVFFVAFIIMFKQF